MTESASPAIRIVVTGGTFDKQYDELRGELTFKDSHLPGILKQARITAEIVLEINQLIDSLHMQDVNRQHILASCRAAPEERIVIVHGTDTMAVTAGMLGEAGLAKTIVLTGAMIPYAVMGSDSLFNLGFAVAAAQLLPHGVYIAMNGQTFPWHNVRKNTASGVFEPMS
jgi:L-asparaginase